MKYRHLTKRDRLKISRLKSYRLSLSEIARRTGFDKSTISRELKRNGCQFEVDHLAEAKYWFKWGELELAEYHITKKNRFESFVSYSCSDAQMWAKSRRTKANKRRLKVNPSAIKWICEKLKAGWSPQQIAGRSKIEGPQKVSHEYIYKLIIRDKKRGGKLYRLLKRFGKRKRRISEWDYTKTLIPGRIAIEQRPKIVAKRRRLGDLEGDLIVGRNHKSYIVTLVDRSSRLVAIEKIKSRDKISVERAFIKAIKRFPVALTLTLDNAREFSCHTEITKATGVRVYFANPYASHERGTIENTNGILRYYLPKRTDFRRITEKRMNRIENALNNRPRKVLGYLTAVEVVNKQRPQSAKRSVALRS